MIAAVVAAVAVLLLVRRCVRRLGGVTGDVMGAAVEIALTVMLVGVAAVSRADETPRYRPQRAAGDHQDDLVADGGDAAG